MSTQQKTLQHIGIIMDGNRRWARKRGLPTLVGHRQGYEKVKKVVDWCIDRKIKIITVFAFSTENWSRSKKEVSYLMNLLKIGLLKDVQGFHEKGVRLKIIGQKNRLSKELQKLIKECETKTKNNKKLVLQLAISYGGRAEIVDALKRIVIKKIPVSKINEKVISDSLWTAQTPDPDIIIRTSGEQRLSGFLMWQSMYSELMFIKNTWPSFSEKDLDNVIQEYKKRQRRFGK